MIFVEYGLLAFCFLTCSIYLYQKFREYRRQRQKRKEYEATTYFKITRNPYQVTKNDLGRFGEYLIYKELAFYESEGARFLFNCYLPMDDGRTTEIDALMITKSGIYVFESKNYSGWISGDEQQKYWTQVLKDSHGSYHEEQFFNPVMQNKLHITWLKKQLNLCGNLGHIPIYSLIVFSKRCTLMDIMVVSPDVKVIHRNEIQKVVARLEKKSSVDHLNKKTIKKIYNLLYPFTQVSETVKKKHIQNIKNKTAKTQESDKVCPLCGARLILRTARRGANSGQQFYGCSGYPNCRYTQNIKEDHGNRAEESW